MIQAHSELVVILNESLRGNEPVFANVGQRKKRQDIRGSRIDRSEKRHLVERYRCSEKGELPIRVAAEPGCRVDGSVEVGTLLREVALPFRRRRHGCRHGLTLLVAEAFVVSEEKGLVLEDRSAEGGAELVLLQRLHALREVIGRIHCVVAKKFPRGPMKRIGPRSRNDIRGRAGVPSELRIRVVTKNLELGNRVDRGLENKSAVHRALIVGAVNHKIV